MGVMRAYSSSVGIGFSTASFLTLLFLERVAVSSLAKLDP